MAVDERSAVEGGVEGVAGAFPSLGTVGSSLPGGIELHDREVDVFRCGLLVGKCPTGLTAFRSRAFTDSIALVVHTIRGIFRAASGIHTALRAELGPIVLPQPGDRRILGPSRGLEVGEPILDLRHCHTR